MSQEKYEYKYNQNFVIKYSDFYKGVATIAEGQSFFNIGDGVINFRVNLNPPDVSKVKKIEIKNINASLTSASGYLYELTCNELIRYPIQFLDSLSAFTNYEEYTSGTLKTLSPTFSIERITGDLPLLPQIQYLINPGLSFTIVFHYW